MRAKLNVEHTVEVKGGIECSTNQLTIVPDRPPNQYKFWEVDPKDTQRLKTLIGFLKKKVKMGP